MVRARDSAGPEEVAGRADPEHQGTRKVRAKGKLAAPSGYYALTPSVRRRLKRPLGVLYVGEALSSKEFLETIRGHVHADHRRRPSNRVRPAGLGRTPDVQVVDKVRGGRQGTRPTSPYSRLVKAKNPAGSITSQAIIAVRKAVKSRKKPARVLIEGEEDLSRSPPSRLPRSALLSSTVSRDGRSPGPRR